MKTRWMLLCLAASLCPVEAAVIVTAEVTPVSGGYSYNYTVDNTEALSLIEFQLRFSAPPVSVLPPPDWMSNMFASGTDTIVQWASATSEIPPASSLSGFIVVSPFAPTQQQFSVTDFDLNVISGTTTMTVAAEQSSTPEPGTSLLAAVGFLSMGMLFRFVARRRAAAASVR